MKAVDELFHKFDTQNSGTLCKADAKKFVENVVIKMKGVGSYSVTEFENWFRQLDDNFSGAIEKHELAEFIAKVAMTETNGRKAASQPQQLAEGNSHIGKLLEYFNNGNLDYLKMCNVGKKIFRCFDFDGNASLDEVELKLLLQ